MAEIGRVQGPSGPPENAPKKDRSSVDADKFKQEMNKKVEKISETDAEQKKKRKRPEEEEEEDVAKQGASTPPEQVTPFSLEADQKKQSPLSVQQGGKVSPLDSAQPTSKPQMAAPPPAAPQAVPSMDEMEDDTGMSEETAFIETVPSTTPPSPTAAPAKPEAMQPAPKEEGPKEEGKAGPPPAEKEEQQPASQSPLTHGSVLTEPPVGAAPKRDASRPSAPTQEKKGVSAQELEAMKSAKKEELPPMAPPSQGAPKQEKIEEQQEIDEMIAPLPTISSLPTPPTEKDKEKKKAEQVTGPGVTPSVEQPFGMAIPEMQAPLPSTAPYANLHPHVLDLFERTVGVMTVLSLSDIKTTSISLNNPKFASSVFFGSEIIIKEYSSAPLAYNIQINATPQAVALIQGNMDDLMAAFQYGNYNFRVNRLETSLLTDKPLFKRKEPPSGDKQNQPGSQDK